MRRQSFLIGGAIVLLLLLAGSGRAEYHPSFDLEFCAWTATHIFLAEQHEDDVTVLKSWRGDLAQGTVIQGLDLPTKQMEVLSVYDEFEAAIAAARLPDVDKAHDAPAKKKRPRPVVNFKRVVLFLVHPPAGTSTLPNVEWEGPGFKHSPQVSAAWFDQDRAYAFRQYCDFKPVGLLPVEWGREELTEKQFLQRMLDILAARDALAKAVTTADLARRFEMLRPMITGPYRHEREDAIAAMGESGSVAVPTLKLILREYGYGASSVASALARAEGDQAGPEMTRLLKEELAFWKKEAPGGPPGFRSLQQARYGVLHVALETIQTAHYLAARDAVQELRDFWVSQPQLDEDASTHHGIAGHCDLVLHALDEPAGGAAGSK